MINKRRLIFLPLFAMSICLLTGCNDEIKNMSEDFQSQIDILRSDIDDLKTQVEELKSQITSLQTEMNDKIKTLKEDYDKQIADIEAEIATLEKELSDLTEMHEKDKKLLEDDYNEKIVALENAHNSDKQLLEDDYNSKLEALQESENADKQELQEDYNAKLAELEQKHNADKQALQDDYSSKFSALQSEFNAKVQQIENNIATANTQISALQTELANQITAVQNDYNSKINDLTSRVAELEKIRTHTVSFNSTGGSETPSQTVIHGEKVSRPNDPYKTGHSFKNWLCQNEPWSFIGYVVTEDMTLWADWSVNQYTIDVYSNDYKAGRVYGAGVYYYNTCAYLRAEPRSGYSFVGWYDGEGNLLSENDTYTIVVEGDRTIYAQFNDGDVYNINYLADGWEFENVPATVQYGHYYELPTPNERPGYNFLGWSFSENGNVISSSGTWNWTSDGIVDLYLKFEYVDYSISYVLNGGENNAENITKYDVTTGFTFLDPIKPGYEFNGWLDASGNKVESINPGTYGDMVLTAQWSAIKYELNVSSNDESKGTVTTDGTGYMDEDISVTAVPKEDCYFLGWFDQNDYFVSKDRNYSFKMKNQSISLKAVFMDKTELDNWKIDHGITPKFSDDEKQVTYGMYPKSLVTNEELIAKLEEMTIKYNDYYYYDGNFYCKTIGNPRTHAITFDNGDLITLGREYWFEVEPINWLVAKNEDGKAFLVAEDVIDNQQYSENTGVYYNLSKIRQWLNDSFFNTAFGLDSSHVTVTNVDNSGQSTLDITNSYACPNTEDKVFLLSAAEVEDDSLEFEGQAIATEYSRAVGAGCSMNNVNLYHSIYWTRSPADGYDNYAMRFVSLEGNVHMYDYIVASGTDGVRPAITLSSEATEAYNIEFENDKMVLLTGQTKKANVAFESNTFDDESSKIKYYSNNTEVALINNNGEVTGVSEGNASVVVFVDVNGNDVKDEGEAFDECDVTVKQEADAIILDYSGLTDKGIMIDTDEETLSLVGLNNTHITAVSCTRVYSGNKDGGAYPDSAGFLKVGTGSGVGIIIITLDSYVSRVDILCHDWRRKESDATNTNTISVNDSEQVLAPFNETATFETLTFELTEPSNVITITTYNRVFIKGIKLY